MARRRPFLVGRRTRRGTVYVLATAWVSPIRGPWVLHAVVVPN